MIINKIKKILIVLYLISTATLIIGVILRVFIGIIIKGFSFDCIFCIIILLGSIISFIVVSQDNKTKNRIFKALKTIVFALIIIAFDIASCSIIQFVDFFGPISYYEQEIEGLPKKYTIVICERSGITSTTGFVCRKINNYLYKNIPNTSFAANSGFYPIETGNYTIEYNEEKKQIIFNHALGENEKMIPIIISISDL